MPWNNSVMFFDFFLSQIWHNLCSMLAPETIYRFNSIISGVLRGRRVFKGYGRLILNSYIFMNKLNVEKSTTLGG